MEPAADPPMGERPPGAGRRWRFRVRRQRPSDLVGAVMCGLIAEWLARALMLDVIPLFAWCRIPGLAVGIVLLLCAAPVQRLFLPIVTGLMLLNAAVSRTDLGGVLVRELAVADVLRRVPAIAVLAGDVRPDGSPDRTTQARLDHAYSLLERGCAPVLVMTRLGVRTVSYVPAVRRQITARGLNVQV